MNDPSKQLYRFDDVAAASTESVVCIYSGHVRPHPLFEVAAEP